MKTGKCISTQKFLYIQFDGNNFAEVCEFLKPQFGDELPVMIPVTERGYRVFEDNIGLTGYGSDIYPGDYIVVERQFSTYGEFEVFPESSFDLLFMVIN